MYDISFQKAKMEFSRLPGVKIEDLSDSGTPVSFGRVDPVEVLRDMNGNAFAVQRLVAPEFSISLIPGSESDKRLAAILRSCLDVSQRGGMIPIPKDLSIGDVNITYPARNKDGEYGLSFKDGFLVGGFPGISSSSDGRMEAQPYSFKFSSLTAYGFIPGDGIIEPQKSGGLVSPVTVIYDGSKELEGLIFIGINGSSRARHTMHPVETGGNRFDGKVNDPDTVTVTAKVKDSDSRKLDGKLQQMVHELRPKFYTVRSFQHTYRNLALEDYSIGESVDKFGCYDVSLKFQQILTFGRQEDSRKSDPSDSKNLAGGSTHGKKA